MARLFICVVLALVCSYVSAKSLPDGDKRCGCPVCPCAPPPPPCGCPICPCAPPPPPPQMVHHITHVNYQHIHHQQPAPPAMPAMPMPPPPPYSTSTVAHEWHCAPACQCPAPCPACPAPCNCCGKK